MKFGNLEQLIAGGESEALELKKSTAQLKGAAETLCALLNAEGGTVIIGVTPAKKIVGQQVSDGTQQDIANVIRKLEPPAPVDIHIVDTNFPNPDYKLVALQAAPATEMRPFTFDGRAYQRIGTTTIVMPQEKYQQLLLERAHGQQRWENQVSLGTTSSLDQEEVLRTVRSGIVAGRLLESTGGDVNDVLNRLGLRSNGSLSNAAIVLFGTGLFPQYPQCQLRMARFRGTDKTEFLDNRQVYGNIFELLDEAMLFLQRHLPVAGRVQPGLFERVDEPLFPPVALREALVNAFCHRDYSIPGGSISLGIYDDRLEIWSDGTLPSDLSVDDLKRDHSSRPRNPLIADVFCKRGLVERWGRGTQKIVELCVRAGHPEPEFIERAGALGVRFLPSGYIAPHRVALDLTTRQREILHLLAGEELPLRDIIAGLTDPPAVTTVRDDIYHLKHVGLVDLRGRGRGAVWFLSQGAVE